MQTQSASKLIILCTLLTLSSLLPYGWGAKCVVNDHDHAPTVKQTQVGFGKLTKFLVEISNNCPMCPVIDVHLKCGSFPQALVKPRLLKVVGFDDCVVNGGLPLAPLQKFSFNYTHNSKYMMQPILWYFQCE
ncbi:hypothetical protein FNV43_RR01664 [Rhamnella rubrinervis]|uniref:Uncharacterized protein n=1 Tax=Rhamnella rubrinervis TaxID=2594499 RepID=A0A8K0HQ19_9ROSA|nr:hypothetical protein FNV43_RR01664 [Rhamnella rubrinervis]